MKSLVLLTSVVVVFLGFFTVSCFAKNIYGNDGPNDQVVMPNQDTTVIFSFIGERFEGEVNLPLFFGYYDNADRMSAEELSDRVDFSVEAGEGENAFLSLSYQKVFGHYRFDLGSAIDTDGCSYGQVGVSANYYIGSLWFFGEISLFPGLTEDAETYVDAKGQVTYLFDGPYYVGSDIDQDGRRDDTFVHILFGTYVWGNDIVLKAGLNNDGDVDTGVMISFQI